MTISHLRAKWAELEPRAKAFAVGTAALMAVSVAITAFNLAGPETDGAGGAGGEPPAATDTEALIPEGAEPIAEPTGQERLLAGLLDVVTKEECLWQATEDPACWMLFERDGFTEFDGDLVTSATVEFYSIEAVEGGRAGTWRVTYEDGSTVDATFAFTQDREAGAWVISSEAFPTHDEYRTVPFTSEDVLSW